MRCYPPTRVQSLIEQYSECQERVKDLENQIQVTEQRLARAGEVLSGVSVEGERWATDAEAVKEDMSNLLGDILMAAGNVSLLTSIDMLFRPNYFQSISFHAS